MLVPLHLFFLKSWGKMFVFCVEGLIPECPFPDPHVSLNLTGGRRGRWGIIMDMAHNSNPVNSSFSFSFFLSFFPSLWHEKPTASWGEPEAYCGAAPLLAPWKAHSSHFFLLNCCASAFQRCILFPSLCTRQSGGMKLHSAILPSSDERY